MRQINIENTNPLEQSQRKPLGTTPSRGQWLNKLVATLGAISTLAVLPLMGAQSVTNWVAFNDHEGGASPNPNVTTYSMTQSGNVGATVGGAMRDFTSGSALPALIEISSTGYINGTTGSSAAPDAGTPADLIFGGKINFVSSALYFGPSPYTASVTITFTNLTPGARYNFRGTAIRGGSYANRWSLATLAGASSSTPAHITGTGTAPWPSPGIITNGWSPYGDTLIPGLQAAWDSGENRSGDVIAWDNIVPIGNTFSVICSNWAAVVGGSGAIPPTGTSGTTTMGATYAYAMEAVMLQEVMDMGPVEITQQPVAATSVEAFAPFSLHVATTGGLPTYQWYKGELGAGEAILGATSSAYAKTSAALEDSGNYYVVVANELNSVTSTVAAVTVFVNPIVITQQPTNQLTALQNRPFTLSVENTGTHPEYQWYKDGQPLLDKTNNTYAVEQASDTDAGDYFVVVSNITTGQTSTVARVVFSTDGVPPSVVRVVGSGNNDQITIEFDEAIGLNVAITCDSLTVYEDRNTRTNANTIVLFTDPQTPGQTYTLNVYVDDLVGNVLFVDVPFTAWVPNLSGGVIFDVYATGTGTAVSNLTSSPIFPDSPTRSMVLTNFCTTNLWPDIASGTPPGIPGNAEAVRENYGGRLRGFFIPPVSGNWRFFLTSDDGGELWINTNGPSADGKQLIAFELDCCDGFLEPSTADATTSLPIPLVAGQVYYLEALYKEQGGGDYCRVGARREGDSTPAASLTEIIANGYPYVPAANYGDMLIVQEPANVSVEAPGSAQLTFVATNTMNTPFSYQWQQSDGAGGFTNVPGAMIKTLTMASLTEPGTTEFRCVAAGVSQVLTSQVATVTVTPDATGPLLVSAARDITQTNILVTFNEALSEASAIIPGNYQICDVFAVGSCVTVLNVILTNNGTAVLLETELPNPAAVYRLTISGVTDVHNNALRPPTAISVNLLASFQQGTANYTGTVDTHVRSDNATTAYGTLVANLADNLSPLCHALLRFDNLFGAGTGQVPPGATVTSAKLYLRTDNWGNDIRLHRMLVDWNASSTWNTVGDANNGVSTNAGGDAVTTPELIFATVAVGTVVEIDVSASVKFWATNAGSNHGWALIDTSDDGYQFNSSEATDITVRPRLVIAYTPDTTVRSVEIVGQPAASQTVNEGANVSFSVSVSGTQPAFQWYKDGAMIPGANAATLSLSSVVETNAGRYYCVVTNFAPSQVTSADALLVVTPDTVAPMVTSVLGTTNASTIQVVFSKKMDPASLGLTDFVVTPAAGGASLDVQGVNLATNGTTVVLLTAPRNPFAQYKIVIQDVADAAYRHNMMTPNPTTVYFASQISLLAPVSDWRYYESGDPGAGWSGTAFDDSTWPVGTALFAAKNGTFGNSDLPINHTNVWVSGLSAYYYRSQFTMPAVSELAGVSSYLLQVRPILDDGAVFYINGTEARRVGMATGEVVHATFANRTQGNDYRYEGPYELPTTSVTFGGNNLLAVEVHQNNATSSDIAFAAEVLVTVLPATPIELQSGVAAGGGTLMLSWPVVPGLMLYQADKVEGPYTLVPNNPVGSYTVNTTTGAGKFYQVRSQ